MIATAADQACQAAEQRLQRGDLEGAITAFEANLSRSPGHVPTLLGLSTALVRTGLHRRPRHLAVRAHAAVADVAPLLFGVARALSYFNESERLVEVLMRPAFREGAPPRVLAEAAVALSNAGDNASAMALYHELASLTPR